MKEIGRGSKDPKDPSFALPDDPNRLNFQDSLGSLKKKFSVNRGSFSGAVSPDDNIQSEEELLESYEEKARADDANDDSEGQK